VYSFTDKDLHEKFEIDKEFYDYELEINGTYCDTALENTCL
jgi:hypothetical protein